MGDNPRIKEEISNLLFIYLGRESAEVLLNGWEDKYEGELDDKALSLLKAVMGNFPLKTL